MTNRGEPIIKSALDRYRDLLDYEHAFSYAETWIGIYARSDPNDFGYGIFPFFEDPEYLSEISPFIEHKRRIDSAIATAMALGPRKVYYDTTPSVDPDRSIDPQLFQSDLDSEFESPAGREWIPNESGTYTNDPNDNCRIWRRPFAELYGVPIDQP